MLRPADHPECGSIMPAMHTKTAHLAEIKSHEHLYHCFCGDLLPGTSDLLRPASA